MPLFGRRWKVEVSFDFALRVANEIEDDKSRSLALSGIAAELAKVGEVKKAKELFEESIRVADGIVDVRSSALVIIAANLAEAGEFEEAIRLPRGLRLMVFAHRLYLI